MPAPTKIDRPTLLHLSLPSSIRGQLDLHLISEVEGRVPKSAYQLFFIERIREFFDSKQLEVEPGVFVRGSKEAIETLKERLNDTRISSKDI